MGTIRVEATYPHPPERVWRGSPIHKRLPSG
jgi:uncharacterized protein YndB with AHSA1/START domain